MPSRAMFLLAAIGLVAGAAPAAHGVIELFNGGTPVMLADILAPTNDHQVKIGDKLFTFTNYNSTTIPLGEVFIAGYIDPNNPNFGIGGSSNSGPDALLIAGAMMMDGLLPGLWVVLAGHETEWIPAADGSPVPAPMCQAIALALTPGKMDGTGIHLSLGQVATAEGIDQAVPEVHLGLLAEEWLHQGTTPQGRWRLSSTHWVEIESNVGDGEIRP